MASIVVRPDNGRLLVLFAYSPERVAKIKTVPGRLWHGPEKYWSVPNDLDMIARLSVLFEGDRVEHPGSPPASPRTTSAPPPRIRRSTRFCSRLSMVLAASSDWFQASYAPNAR